jgi:hypothetical protein
MFNKKFKKFFDQPPPPPPPARNLDVYDRVLRSPQLYPVLSQTNPANISNPTAFKLFQYYPFKSPRQSVHFRVSE